jgi:hypothetical protein
MNTEARDRGTAKKKNRRKKTSGTKGESERNEDTQLRAVCVSYDGLSPFSVLHWFPPARGVHVVG